MGDEVIDQFGIPKHKLEEFVEDPSFPNGNYFKNVSPGVKKLYEQLIAEPYEEDLEEIKPTKVYTKAASMNFYTSYQVVR